MRLFLEDKDFFAAFRLNFLMFGLSENLVVENVQMTWDYLFNPWSKEALPLSASRAIYGLSNFSQLEEAC